MKLYHRSMFTLMAVMTIFSIILFIYSIVNLHPNASVVKVSYGDIGRYQVESGLQCRILVDIMTEHGMRCQYPLFALIFEY